MTALTAARWRMAAEDLHALAWLHAHERGPAELMALVEGGFPAGLSLLQATDPEVLALEQAMAQLAGLDDTQRARCGDDLAADYTAIYLTNSLRASPYESVWRDDDQLMMQEPTFAVRAFYARHGMAVPNWRHMPDDHLAHEIEFVAHLLERAELQQAARFLQDHLMYWLPDFAATVQQRANTRLYAALAALTLAACRRLQAALPAVKPFPPLVAALRSADTSGVTTPMAGCGQG